jgi:recombination protein RecA
MTPKKPMTKAEKLKILVKCAAKINEQAKKKVCGFMTDPDIAEKLRIKWYPTPSDNVNAIAGGGFPRGRMTLIVGMPDSGKTSYALETIAINQKLDPDFVAAWLESENSITKDYACRVFGIDPDRFLFIEHERTGAGEKALDNIELIMSSGAVNMIIVNSLKCLVPSEEYKKAHGDATVGTQARMNAKMTRKFTAIMAETEVAFVVITHLTTQIGSKSKDPMIPTGGYAIVFASQLTLDFRKRFILEEDPIAKEDGAKFGVKVKKNHCVPDRNPYLQTEYFIIYGVGVEQYLETLTNALTQGVLIKKGAYIRDPDEFGEPLVVDGVKYQWQGEKKYREYMQANPEYFEKLKARVAANIVPLSDEEVEEIKAEEADIETKAKEEESE